MKIHDIAGFANPLRVRIALAEKGLLDQVEFVPVDVMGGEHRKPAFLAKNPSGTVPVLELDDGTFLSECTAITEYLDHAHGEKTLTGRTALERGIIHMLQRKVEAGFLNAVGAYFHHATNGLGPVLETYQNQDWGRHQREIALKTLVWMDGLLEEHDYLAGDQFTVVDITAMAGFAFASAAGIAIPDDLTRLTAWHQRVTGRPSLARAV